MKNLKMPKKATRFFVYGLVIAFGLAVAGVDGATSIDVNEWVDKGSRLTSALALILAMLNPKEDPPQGEVGAPADE